MEVAENEIRFIDLFSGIGGFRLGLERAGGYLCVWSCDNSKYANDVYEHRFGKTGHCSNDVRGIDPKTIPDFDLLCAGFPCQSFSVAGHRKGFAETRGTLFFQICRIAEARKPALLLLENVKGVLSNDEGLTFQIILESLAELGYWVEWQVLNSLHFGVPQNRERVFIVGHLGTRGGREIFPIGQTNKMAKREGFRRPLLQTNEKQVIPVLTPERYEKKQHGRRFKDAGEPMYTLTGQDQHGVLIFADRSRHLNKRGRNFESPKPFTNALSSVQKDNLLLQNGKFRRLTPLECERLQGFPDGWADILSNTQRYKCIGNAVTVNVVEFLGHVLRLSLSGYNPHSWSINPQTGRKNGQSEPTGAQTDAKATMGASPCPSDLSSQPTEAF